MAIDINLANIANLQNETSAVNLINANMASITDAFAEVVSETGTIPNQMQSNLDMNSNRILNLPAPSSTLEPARQLDLQNAVLGGSGSLNILALTNTTDSTTPTTGSITTAGGVGIAKALNVGTTLTVAGNETVTGTSVSTMAASTIKGRPAASSGVSSDFTIQGLTAKGSVDASNDKMLIFDNSTSTLKSVTPLLIANAATAGVTTLNGQSGALNMFTMPCGRLTLTTGVAVMATSVAAATTIYFTPTGGNQMPLYDGTNMVPTVFAEVSQLTTDATKSPAACTTNSNYDLFAWSDAGTFRVTRGPLWTSSIARGAGAGTTELQLQSGLYLNKNSITNGPAALRGTYVGTIRTNGSSQVDWSLGAQGTATSLGVWNNFNRAQVNSSCCDATASWTYATAVIRQARASVINQASWISGLAEEGADVSVNVTTATAAASGAQNNFGLALDSTTVYDKNGSILAPTASGSGTQSSCIRHMYAPQLGWHTVSHNESGDGTNTGTTVGQARHNITLGTHM